MKMFGFYDSTFEDYTESGTYIDVFIAANGCDSTRILELLVIPAIEVTDTLVTPDTGTGNGAISITVEGGVPPYSFLWSNGETSQDILNLAAGTYTLEITDSYACTEEFTFVVTLETTVKNINHGNIEMYPNPAGKGTTAFLAYSGNQPISVEISLVSMLGESVLMDGVELEADGLYPIGTPERQGMYFLIIKTDNQILKVFKLVILD
jgi:hypothetical protein